MAKFVEGAGIILTEEEKELLKASSSPNSTMIPNLRKFISDGFVGWEVKERKIPVKDLDKELEGHGIPDLEHTYPDDFISEREQETKEQEFYK